MHRAKTRTGRKPAPGENLHRAKSCIVQVFAGKKIQNRPENIKIAPTPDSRGRKRQAKTGTGRKSENRGNSRADRGQYRNARTTQAERERERGEDSAWQGKGRSSIAHMQHQESSVLASGSICSALQQSASCGLGAFDQMDVTGGLAAFDVKSSGGMGSFGYDDPSAGAMGNNTGFGVQPFFNMQLGGLDIPEKSIVSVLDMKKPLASCRLGARNGFPVRRVTQSDVLSVLHMPQEEAARKLQISLSVLKRACKELGLPKWHKRHAIIRDWNLDKQLGAPPGVVSQPAFLPPMLLEPPALQGKYKGFGKPLTYTYPSISDVTARPSGLVTPKLKDKAQDMDIFSETEMHDLEPHTLSFGTGLDIWPNQDMDGP